MYYILYFVIYNILHFQTFKMDDYDDQSVPGFATRDDIKRVADEQFTAAVKEHEQTRNYVDINIKGKMFFLKCYIEIWVAHMFQVLEMMLKRAWKNFKKGSPGETGFFENSFAHKTVINSIAPIFFLCCSNQEAFLDPF